MWVISFSRTHQTYSYLGVIAFVLCVPGTLSPYIFSWFIPPCHSSSSINGTSLERPSLTTPPTWSQLIQPPIMSSFIVFLALICYFLVCFLLLLFICLFVHGLCSPYLQIEWKFCKSRDFVLSNPSNHSYIPAVQKSC